MTEQTRDCMPKSPVKINFAGLSAETKEPVSVAPNPRVETRSANCGARPPVHDSQQIEKDRLLALCLSGVRPRRVPGGNPLEVR